MKIFTWWFILAIILTHQNKGCAGIDTKRNMSHKELMDIVKNKTTFALDISCLYENVSKYANFYARVALLITVLLIFHYSKKKTRIMEKKDSTNLEPTQKVMENLEHLSAVIDATAVGVVAIDQDKLVSYMNATAAKMCGVRAQAAIGRPVSLIVKLERGVRRSDPISRLQDFGTNYFTPDSTYILRSLDKRRIRIQTTASPLAVRGEETGTVILLVDISASFKLMKKLVKNASYDQLTGLPNRSSFETHLKDAVSGLVGVEMKHALVFLDLDGFKAVNDNAGHAAGDALLKNIARLLQAKLRHSDFLARLAGDEFGFILYECELLHAKSIMDIIVYNIHKYSFYWEGKKLRVGASAGIVSIDCAVASNSELLARADAACYDAKHRGKGQVRIYQES